MSNWKTLKVGKFAQTASGGTPSTSRKDFWENGTISWINSGELSHYDFVTNPTTYITENGLQYSSAKLFPKGTVVIALTGATTGMVSYLDIETTTNQSIVGIFPNGTLNNLYLFYYLKNKRPYILGFNVGSAQEHINKQIIDSLEISFPENPQEQSKIAEVLITFDRAIAQTEALIAKHQRIKTGLMQDLLTSGIDEHGQLRHPSSHRFKSTPLGMIPEEWEYSPLDKFLSGKIYGISSSLKEDGEIPVLRMSNLENGKVSLESLKFTSYFFASKHLLLYGDVLFNRTNSAELVGKTGIYLGQSGTTSYASYLVKLVPNEKMLSRYLNYLLNDPSTHLRIKALGTLGVSQVNINPTNLGRLFVTCPKDIEEQKAIIERLDSSDQNRETYKVLLQKLEMLKMGLMQDLLSGKVPVMPLLEG